MSGCGSSPGDCQRPRHVALVVGERGDRLAGYKRSHCYIQGNKTHNCQCDQRVVEPTHAVCPSINVLLLRAVRRKAVVRLVRAKWTIKNRFHPKVVWIAKIGWVVSTCLLTPRVSDLRRKPLEGSVSRRGFLFAPVVDRIAGGRNVAERRSTLARGSYFCRKIGVSSYATEERMIETPQCPCRYGRPLRCSRDPGSRLVDRIGNVASSPSMEPT